MFAEMVECLLTPCPRHLRQMGYLREAVGMKARFRRCREAWEPHLERTRAVIRSARDRCPQRRKVVVFGPSSLCEVLLPELAGHFREVVLVDTVHALGISRRVRRWQNVTAQAADLSGVAESVFRAAKTQGSELPQSMPNLFRDDPDVDLVASICMLAQLAFIPAQYLLRAGTHDRDTITDFARNLIRSHLEYLRSFPGTVALIADVEQLKVTAGGTVVDRVDTLWGVPLPWAGEDWTWEIAPRPEADWNLSHQVRIVGIPDVKTARART
jgi:hypothetical protein